MLKKTISFKTHTVLEIVRSDQIIYSKTMKLIF